MIRRRSAIEPAIDHIKTDGKLDWSWLNGALGDAMHAVLRGTDHNPRIFYAPILVTLLSCKSVAPSAT
jgi:IS5 family transposase